MTKETAETFSEIVELLDIAERSIGVAQQAGFTSNAERRANANVRRLIRLARRKIAMLELHDEIPASFADDDTTGVMLS